MADPYYVRCLVGERGIHRSVIIYRPDMCGQALEALSHAYREGWTTKALAMESSEIIYTDSRDLCLWIRDHGHPHYELYEECGAVHRLLVNARLQIAHGLGLVATDAPARRKS